MRSIKRAVSLVALASVVGAATAEAQDGIAVGYADIGAVVGFGSIGEAGLALGGRFETIIKPLPDMGGGMLGLRFGADWYSYDIGVVGTHYSWTYIPVSGTANYHFKMENKKIDPFVGLGLGYYIVSVPSGWPGGSYNSGLYLVSVVGLRYFINPSMAFIADAGVGAGALHVGLAWKLKSGSASASRSR
jgi:hypothetical protein